MRVQPKALQIKLLSAALASSLMALAMGADTGLGPADRAFVGKAAQGGMMEVAAGKLAAQRAQDPGVRSFGQQMVTDHTAANELLKSLADSKQMTLPDSVTPAAQIELGKLEGLNGGDFDKAYAQLMVQDHVADIKEFEKEAGGGQDADVKAYAEHTLATLRHHLMQANLLSTQEKKNPSRPPSRSR